MEQRICENADIFLHVKQLSTWSAIVTGHRKSVFMNLIRDASYREKKNLVTFKNYDNFLLFVVEKYLNSLDSEKL